MLPDIHSSETFLSKKTLVIGSICTVGLIVLIAVLGSESSNQNGSLVAGSSGSHQGNSGNLTGSETGSPSVSPTPVPETLIRWVIPYDGPLVLNATVGSILRFDMDQGSIPHDVYQLSTETEFDSCSKQTGDLLCDGSECAVTVEAGEQYFICTIGMHCEAGQKIAVFGVVETESPSASPTLLPTSSPSDLPTGVPSVAPSATPSDAPSPVPSSSPASSPTSSPTSTPTSAPTGSPSGATQSPTEEVSAAPSSLPTRSPTTSDTAPPSSAPTSKPTVEGAISPAPTIGISASEKTQAPTRRRVGWGPSMDPGTS